MMADARAGRTGPGGHLGAATDSSAAGSDPIAGTSDKSLPGPASHDPTPPGRSVPRAAPAAFQIQPDRSRGSSDLCLTAIRTG